jgi:hypothetical protein
MKSKLWRKAQEQFLRQFGGTKPIDLLYSQFKKFNTENGLPQKSFRVFRNKLNSMNLSQLDGSDYVGIQELADLMGRSRTAIGLYINKGLPIVHRYSRNAYTTYEEIYKFAKKYPKYFGGITQERLVRILGDEDLARKIIRQYPKKLDAAQPVPVICVETGVVYKTMTEAAERHFVTAEALRKAVSENRKCVGFTFRKHERNNSVLRGRNANSARQQDADAWQDDRQQPKAQAMA